MKKAVPFILIFIILLVGIGVLSYPLISSVVNNMQFRNEATEYIQKANNTESEEITELFSEAEIYNKNLLTSVILSDPFDDETYEKITKNYENTFNTGLNGLIGYIEIPKINVYLPIFHGTSMEVLSMGAGHLENTSFPVGGESTHSVISAHSAYPTETFFDYLTELEDGDAFFIHVLNRTLKYEVDEINVVLPTDTSDLHIYEGRDLVTLITCTPYSVNTHRLLVRGTRVPYEEESFKDETMRVINADAGNMYFFGYKLPFWEVAVILVSFVAIVAMIVVVILYIRRQRAKKKAGENGG